MTERLTPKRLKEIRDPLVCLIPKPGIRMPSCHEKSICDCTVLEVFTEIDHQAKEIEELRGYVGKLREALEFYSHKRTPTTGTEARMGIQPIDLDNGDRAREALALEMPGSNNNKQRREDETT